MAKHQGLITAVDPVFIGPLRAYATLMQLPTRDRPHVAYAYLKIMAVPSSHASGEFSWQNAATWRVAVCIRMPMRARTLRGRCARRGARLVRSPGLPWGCGWPRSGAGCGCAFVVHSRKGVLPETPL